MPRQEILIKALERLDLAQIASLAGFAPQQSRGDRLALLQALFPLVTDPVHLERLEDLSSVLAYQPGLSADAGPLLESLKARLQAELGPLAIEWTSPQDLLMGFLKEGVRAEWQRERKPRGEATRWLPPCLPPVELLVACYRSLSERTLSGFVVIPDMVGRRTYYLQGRKGVCPRGEGCAARLACARCGGNGLKPEGELEAALASGSCSVRGEAAHLRESRKLTPLTWRRLLGRSAVECVQCEGRGRTLCECALYITVPAKARPQWICKLDGAKRDFFSFGRLDRLEG